MRPGPRPQRTSVPGVGRGSARAPGTPFAPHPATAASTPPAPTPSLSARWPPSRPLARLVLPHHHRRQTPNADRPSPYPESIPTPLLVDARPGIIAPRCLTQTTVTERGSFAIALLRTRAGRARPAAVANRAVPRPTPTTLHLPPPPHPPPRPRRPPPPQSDTRAATRVGGRPHGEEPAQRLTRPPGATNATGPTLPTAAAAPPPTAPATTGCGPAAHPRPAPPPPRAPAPRPAEPPGHRAGPGHLGRPAHSLEGRLVRPGDADYAAARKLYKPCFYSQNLNAVAYAAHEVDVEESVAYARHHHTPVLTRNDGHHYAGLRRPDPYVSSSTCRGSPPGVAPMTAPSARSFAPGCSTGPRQ